MDIPFGLKIELEVDFYFLKLDRMSSQVETLMKPRCHITSLHSFFSHILDSYCSLNSLGPKSSYQIDKMAQLQSCLSPPVNQDSSPRAKWLFVYTCSFLEKLPFLSILSKFLWFRTLISTQLNTRLQSLIKFYSPNSHILFGRIK